METIEMAASDKALAQTGAMHGKVAFITGATRGLGRELALMLAQAGADVALVGRDRAAGDAVAAEIRQLGREALALAADVTAGEEMELAARAALACFGRVDLLLCVAGVGSPRKPVWECDAADYHACFDINVLGVMLALRAVLPAMVARKQGRVVVIGGTYGHKGVAGSALYAASKWALRGLVKSVAREVGEHGITANLVSPGGVAGPRLTRLFQQSAAREGLSYEAVLERFTAGSALGRLVEGEDIARAVLHLASDAGRMCTGQDIVVDAGTVV